ncbi:hypothetical protein [Sinomonas susongensis]|uniref:hypothetical protein n=1 Tax=Sinomonas susongensis TaxID=1324851 RepID=UPI0011089E8D|nr:hypothetical protein [Sinomonas susongensis]
MTALALAAALAVFAGLHALEDQEQKDLRAQAAQQLGLAAGTAGSSAASASSPRASAAPSPKATGRTPTSAATSSVQATSAAVGGFQPTDLPPRHFAWPAAGLGVDVVPMQWSATQTVDPPLDANGFDPVGHWLTGTGESASVRPVVLAGHTCHQQVALCTDATFPFNRLSYAGWALGQPASLTEANGSIVNCALADRRIVDKSKAFSFANDPCEVVLFSCNYDNPDAQIVLLTFRCGQCT